MSRNDFVTFFLGLGNVVPHASVAHPQIPNPGTD